MNKIRDANDAVDKIKNSFSHLFQKGFQVVYKMYDNQSFGNWIVVLRSENCILRFVQDKGYIDVTVGPPWVSSDTNEREHFFELHLLIDYLNKKQLTVLSPSQPQNIDIQLDNIKSLLLAYYDQIISFLSAADFLQKEKEIKLLRLKTLKQMYPFMKFPDEA